MEGPRVSRSHPRLEAGLPCQGDQVSRGSAEGLLGQRVSAPRAAGPVLRCLPSDPHLCCLPKRLPASPPHLRTEGYSVRMPLAGHRGASPFYKDIYVFLEFERGLLGIISQPELWKKAVSS